MVNRMEYEGGGGFRLDWYAALLAVAAVAGGALVLARGFGYGIGLEWDSVEHIAAARSLLAGNGFTGYSGLPYEAFPPLYPLLLAAASLWGVLDPHSVAGPLNAVIFAATIAAAGIYLRTRLQSGLLAAAGCLAAMLSIPLAGAAAWALPETAFVLWTTLALIHTERLLSGGKMSALLWAAGFTALAGLTNYMGLAVLATVIILLALQGGTAALDKVKRIGIYALIGIVPLGLWLLWRLLSGGETDASGGIASGSFRDALAGIPATLFGWVIPDLPGISLAQLGLGTVIIALGALGLLAAILLCVFAIAYDYSGRSEGGYYDAEGPRPGYVFGGFALLYFIALLTTLALGDAGGAGFQTRQLAPVYLPLLFLGLLAADLFLARRQEQGRAGNGAMPLPLAVLAAALGIWLALLAVSNGRAVAAANQGSDAELGYAGAGWVDSPLPDYLERAAADGGAVFTNNLAAAYIHQNRPQETPQETPGELRRLPCDLSELRTALAAESAAGPVSIAWLPGRGDRECDTAADGGGTDYGTAGLLTTPGLEPTALLGYGVGFAFDAAGVGNADFYRRYPAHDVATGGEIDGRDGAFDVYVGARTVSYLRESCAAEDTATPFYLHITPNDRSRQPAGIRDAGLEFRDFRFEERGAIFGEQCLAFAPLPDYSIGNISTGQSDELRHWQVNATLYRSKYDYAVAGTPALRTDFEVYVQDDAVVYIRESCAIDDTAAPFFLHLIPVDSDDLPAGRRELGFQNRDFVFSQAGGRFDGKCLASVPLPDYAVGVIRTGQYITGDDRLWEGEIYTDAYFDAQRSRYAALTAGAPIAEGFFDIYRSGDAVIYARAECAAADTEAPFFLHLFPADANDLPAGRQEYGYENRDFGFEQAGSVRIDGKCLFSAPLPDYPLAGIRTGQYIPGQDRLWTATTLPGDDAAQGVGTAATPDVPTPLQPTATASTAPAADVPALRDKYAMLAGLEPIAEDFFDLYQVGGELIYAREGCAAGDTAATFFLHLIPADVNDLDEGRRAHGYENLRFEFDLEGGGEFDGNCLAAVPLPGYTVIGVRTGQLDSDGGTRLWESEGWLGAAMLEYLAMEQPAARGDFDVYHKAGRVYYIEILCAASATEAGFLLHVYPVDGDDLPRQARENGVEFENRDFAFEDNGTRLGRQCIATALLPDYPIHKIATGQYRLWEKEFMVQ